MNPHILNTEVWHWKISITSLYLVQQKQNIYYENASNNFILSINVLTNKCDSYKIKLVKSGTFFGVFRRRKAFQ